LVYAVGKLLVTLNTKTQNQRFFYGSVTDITCIDLFNSGDMIVTSSNDKIPAVKLWDYNDTSCIHTYQIKNLTKIQCISVSNNDKAVAITGKDSYNRECIVVLDVNNVRAQKKNQINILAKQVSDFQITSIKFSPFEPLRLVSCGKENIRFWRIKTKHLPGCAVVLDKFARNTHFTALGYEALGESAERSVKKMVTPVKVYVGTLTGLLY